MGTRGRKSGAALEVVQSPSVGVMEKVARPAPPAQLSDEQADVWREVVDAMPADHFDGATFEMLAQYCRHTVAARRVAQLIEAAEQSDAIDVAEYDQLLKMQDREGRALSSLATRMRTAQQATTNHRGNRSGGKKTNAPWQS